MKIDDDDDDDGYCWRVSRTVGTGQMSELSIYMESGLRCIRILVSRYSQRCWSDGLDVVDFNLFYLALSGQALISRSYRLVISRED